MTMTTHKPTPGARQLYYTDIAAEYRQRIESGELPPGTRLPSVEAMAVHHGVTKVTMYRAISLLQDELYITTRGRGHPNHVHLSGQERKAALLCNMLNKLDADGEGVQLHTTPGNRKITGRGWAVVMDGHGWHTETTYNA